VACDFDLKYVVDMSYRCSMVSRKAASVLVFQASSGRNGWRRMSFEYES